MPASRAVCSGSPFFDRAAPDQPQRLARHRDRPARDRLARGHRLVADVDHLDAAARVDVRQRPSLGGCSRPSSSPCARKNDRLSSDTVRSTLFSFTSGGHLQRAGREIQDRLDAGGDHLVDDVLRVTARARR